MGWLDYPDTQFYFQDLSWQDLSWRRLSSREVSVSPDFSFRHTFGISFQDLSWLEAGVPLSPTATVRRAARCRRFCPPLWPCRVPIEPPRSPGSNGGLSFVGGAAVRRRRSPELPLRSGRGGRRPARPGQTWQWDRGAYCQRPRPRQLAALPRGWPVGPAQ